MYWILCGMRPQLMVNWHHSSVLRTREHYELHLQWRTHKDNYGHFQENTQPINPLPFICNFEQVFSCKAKALTYSNSINKLQNKRTVMYKAIINKTLVSLLSTWNTISNSFIFTSDHLCLTIFQHYAIKG